VTFEPLLGFNSTGVDIGHWPTIPSTVQALTAQVPSGPDSLRIEFLHLQGRELNELSQTRSITVPEQGESFYLFRSLPGLESSSTDVGCGDGRADKEFP
jgi:hypothetical protein